MIDSLSELSSLNETISESESFEFTSLMIDAKISSESFSISMLFLSFLGLPLPCFTSFSGFAIFGRPFFVSASTYSKWTSFNTILNFAASSLTCSSFKLFFFMYFMKEIGLFPDGSLYSYSPAFMRSSILPWSGIFDSFFSA